MLPRLSSRPPLSLRPRVPGEELTVVPLAEIVEASYDSTLQQVTATVRDPSGGEALLAHPYTSQGREGVEALLAALAKKTHSPVFVAGKLESRAGSPVIHPTALVFEERGERKALLPWIACHTGSSTLPPRAPAPATGTGSYSSLLEEVLGETFLLGLRQADEKLERAWSELATRGRSLGFHRVCDYVELVSHELAKRHDTLTWESGKALETIADLLVIARLMGDSLPDSPLQIRDTFDTRGYLGTDT